MNDSWTHIHEPVKNGSWTRGFNNVFKKDSWFGSWTNDERFMHLLFKKDSWFGSWTYDERFMHLNRLCGSWIVHKTFLTLF